jgi:hypothetical protein
MIASHFWRDSRTLTTDGLLDTTGDDGDVGIIRSPLRAIVLPDPRVPSDSDM